MRRNVTVAVVAVAALVFLAGTAQAGDQIKKSFVAPASFSATVLSSACSATPGPQVSLEGSLTLAGVAVDVIFTNPSGGPTQSEQTRIPKNVVPENQPVAIPERAVTAPIGDNPFLWLQLTDDHGRPLTSEIFLGRCEQGTFTPTANIEVPVEALSIVSTESCSSSAIATVQGELTLQPVNGRLIFRNTDTVSGPKGQISEAKVDLAMIPAGQVYVFPQQDAISAMGGNPKISLQFHQDPTGPMFGSEYTLGRCQSLTVQQ